VAAPAPAPAPAAAPAPAPADGAGAGAPLREIAPLKPDAEAGAGACDEAEEGAPPAPLLASLGRRTEVALVAVLDGSALAAVGADANECGTAYGSVPRYISSAAAAADIVG